MKKNIIKIALLGLFFFAINSCKDINTEKVKNNFPRPEETIGYEKQDDCSWCGNPLKEKRFQVKLRKIDKKNMFVYAFGIWDGELGGTDGLVGTEPNPFDKLENPYNGLKFCSLKCLNEFSSSKLVNTKFELVNNDGFVGNLGRGGGPIDFNEGNK